MLYDRGLQTPEQIRDYYKWQSKLGTPGHERSGCISARLCENCFHLISDSICLCIPYFICPNCGFENGKEIRERNEKDTLLRQKFGIGTSSFYNLDEREKGYQACKTKVLELVDRCHHSSTHFEWLSEELKKL